jgi:hypothetical protein
MHYIHTHTSSVCVVPYSIWNFPYGLKFGFHFYYDLPCKAMFSKVLSTIINSLCGRRRLKAGIKALKLGDYDCLVLLSYKCIINLSI